MVSRGFEKIPESIHWVTATAALLRKGQPVNWEQRKKNVRNKDGKLVQSDVSKAGITWKAIDQIRSTGTVQAVTFSQLSRRFQDLLFPFKAALICWASDLLVYEKHI